MDKEQALAFADQLESCANDIRAKVNHPSFAAAPSGAQAGPPWLAGVLQVVSILKQILNAIPTP